MLSGLALAGRGFRSAQAVEPLLQSYVPVQIVAPVPPQPLQALALYGSLQTAGEPQLFGGSGLQRRGKIDAAGEMQGGNLPGMRRFLRLPIREVFGFLTKSVHAAGPVLGIDAYQARRRAKGWG